MDEPAADRDRRREAAERIAQMDLPVGSWEEMEQEIIRSLGALPDIERKQPESR